MCKNKEKRDHEFETKQEVESTAETLEGGKGMGKLYYNLKKQNLSSIQNLNQNNSECILRFHFCFFLSQTTT